MAVLYSTNGVPLRLASRLTGSQRSRLDAHGSRWRKWMAPGPTSKTRHTLPWALRSLDASAGGPAPRCCPARVAITTPAEARTTPALPRQVPWCAPVENRPKIQFSALRARICDCRRRSRPAQVLLSNPNPHQIDAKSSRVSNLATEQLFLPHDISFVFRVSV